jgi:hypothetical protein
MKKNQSDHDLLIELRTEVLNIRDDIKELKEGTTSRIINLEKDKADRVELDALQIKVNHDIEVRVRVLENKTSKYMITLTLYSIAVGTMIALIVYHILQT